VERVSDAARVQVVCEVVVEPGPDVLVDGLQFDEDQGQPVDQAHEVRAAVVVRNPHALDFELPHGQETVVAGVAEVDDLRSRILRFAALITPVHWNAATDEPVELAVMLDE
jgi:hypothetical protein